MDVFVGKSPMLGSPSPLPPSLDTVEGTKGKKLQGESNSDNIYITTDESFSC